MKAVNEREKPGESDTVGLAARMVPAFLERRVLILAPTGKDAALTAHFLAKANLAAHICDEVTQVCAEIRSGCGTILLAEEALGQNPIFVLIQTLAAQPSWSDIPIILITSGGEVSQTRLRRLAMFGPAGNVNVLERPFRPSTLISAVEVALRSRQRQYEARRLMESLSDARASMEMTLGVAEVGTWTWDVQNDRIVADKNLARLFSVTDSDAAGGPIAKYLLAIHSEDRARVEAVMDDALKSEDGQYEVDYRILQPDHSIRWVTGRGKLERDVQGQPARFPGVIIDITARKHAEALLQQSGAMFSTLVDMAPTGVYVVGPDFRLRQINARALPAFAQVEPKIGRDFSEVMNILWGPKVGAELSTIFRNTLATGEPYKSPRFAGHRLDLHEDRTYEWETQRVTLPDGSYGVVCYFNDITQRIQSEEALINAKAAAESASRAKDAFLAALSHELRTPLNPALLIASDSAADHELPEAVRLNFERIHKSIELEARLIDDLLDLTRIAAGKMILDTSLVDSHMILSDAIATMQVHQQEKQIHLEIHLDAPRSVIEGDPVRLQQVFWNILSNAVKFTPQGGKILVQTSAEPRNELLVTITDSGIGMSADETARVFAAFVQGDHARGGGSHRFGGLGLGLAIASKVIQLHGGKITAHSAGRDQGSTFLIKLPLAKATKTGPQPGDDSPKRTTHSKTATDSMSILLVEDHGITRAVLTQLLMRKNHRVSAVDSIAKAREIASQNKFDVLVTDIGLPDGNGNDLMSELREKYGLRGIALTGYGMEEDLARSKAAGFVTHLIKPVRIQSLDNALKAVKTAIEGQQQGD